MERHLLDGTLSLVIGIFVCTGGCSSGGGSGDDMGVQDPDVTEIPLHDPGAGEDTAVPGESLEPAPVCIDPWEGKPWDVQEDKTFLRGPYLQSVFPDSAVVVWRTQEVATDEGCVHYQVSGADLTACDAPDQKGQYEVTLTGLPPYAEIPYRVSIGTDTQTKDLFFRTAPDDLRPVRMLVFSDGHNNVETLSTWAASGLADGTDLVVSIGDLTGSAKDVEFDEFLVGLRPLLHKVPLWPVLGNHEDRGDEYFETFVVPGAGPEPPEEIYYSVRWGNVWLGMLELVDFDIAAWVGMDTPEVAWLKEELSGSKAREAHWRLLFIHEPPWTVGGMPCGHYEGQDTLRKVLVPLAADYGVVAIFSGHHHAWERGVQQGVHLFVSGGGGGGLGEACPVPESFPAGWTPEVVVHHRLRVDAGCDVLSVTPLDLDDQPFDPVEIPFEEAPALPD